MKIKKIYKMITFFLVSIYIISILPFEFVKADFDKAVLKRNVILILDTSSDAIFINDKGEEIYTAASSLKDVKRTAEVFVRDLFDMKEDTDLAIITFSDDATLSLSFTNNQSKIENIIESLSVSGGKRNLTDALEIAYNQMRNIIDKDSKKTAVIISPGMVNCGSSLYNGHWNDESDGGEWLDTTTEIPLYAYANSAFDKANDLKSLETEIYTIGTFNNMSNPPEEVKGAALLFQNTLRDIASDSLHYYPVYDTSNLSFAFGNIIGEISSPECKEGYFYYSSGDDKDYSAKYYYRDDYFSTSAQEYNKSLSTMSLCLAMSAFGTNEPNLSSGGYLSENDLYSDNYKNAQDLLEKLNFQAIEHNEYFELVPTLDSIGVIAGLRKIEIDSKKYTLIAVAVRGANYEAEWGANLLLGESGNHLGFENAKNKVLDFLVKYISAKSDLI